LERVAHVTFGIHVPLDSVGGMLTGLAGTGSVRALDDTQRRYEIRLLREARLPWLETQLAQWEQHGFLTYEWAAP
jgi:hypothetical protein